MASTPDLARLTRFALDSGASVRLVGDDRQLAAIGAGGVLRDLAETTSAVSLVEAVRFADADEAAAALAVRDGRLDAFAYYVEAKRIHVGDSHTAGMSAYDAWARDRAAGRDSLLLAATRKQVTALNARARSDRLATDGCAGAEIRLHDGSQVSAGDPIVTRRNDRRLGITATDWVKNGDRWTVQHVLDTGSLIAVHRDTGRHITLPAAYVREHVDLGYAVTIHAAQGATADTCHVVISGSESREQLYVALTRGRLANHVHVALPDASDDHAPVRSDTLVPPTALDLLGRVVNREDTARSASTEARALVNPVAQLGDAVDRYVDSLALAPVDHGPPLRPAPLPWLEPVPTCADPAWESYLEARAEQIWELADTVVRDVSHRASPAAVHNRRDLMLLSHLALWGATHGDVDQSLTPKEEAYLAHLEARAAGPLDDDADRWSNLVAAVAPTALDMPGYPQLAASLTDALATGLDVDRLLPSLFADPSDYASAPAVVAEVVRIARERAADDDRKHRVARPAFAAPSLSAAAPAPTIDSPHI